MTKISNIWFRIIQKNVRSSIFDAIHLDNGEDNYGAI